MNEKNVPNWMLIALVVGLGELTYWLSTRFGTGLLTKSSLGLTVAAGLICLGIIASRMIRARKR